MTQKHLHDEHNLCTGWLTSLITLKFPELKTPHLFQSPRFHLSA
uniref:Uncharacterized protein n=1 Tax=Rhizophora mucronata TaxID=61149 RepID=A0A2P2QMV3_RHIMU